MRAGRLRETMAADEPVASQNDSGEEVIAWTERATFRADVLPLHGRERIQANGLNANIDARIVARWSPFWDTVTAKWRLRHLNKGGTTEDGQPGVPYNISAPPANLEMRNHEVEIMVTTGQNQG